MADEQCERYVPPRHVLDPSSESRRLYGPYAVCHPTAVTRVAEAMRAAIDAFALMDAIAASEPPSSNGPDALRGDALVEALAALAVPG